MKEAVLDRPRGKVLTYEDYLRLEDEKRYELINGRLKEMPAPTTEHQRILKRLMKVILPMEDESKWEVLPSPVDVILSENVVLQPDIVIVFQQGKSEVRGRIFGPPDLVVEVVSPSSYARDRYEKFSLYEKYGVKEYWLVYPEYRAIEVWCLKDGKYALHSVAVGSGEVASCVLKGFKVKVEEVLK